MDGEGQREREREQTAKPLHPSISLSPFSLLSPLSSLHSSQNTVYQRYPRVHEFDCTAGPISDEDAAPAPRRSGRQSHGALSGSGDAPADTPALSIQVPDLASGGWVYNGTHTLADLPPRVSDMRDPLGGAPWPTGAAAGAPRPRPHPRPSPPPAPAGPVTAHAWVRAFKAGAGYGSYDTSYTLYVSADGADTPLRLVARGRNLWSDGHFDATTAEYTGWDPAPSFAGSGGGGGGGSGVVVLDKQLHDQRAFFVHKVMPPRFHEPQPQLGISREQRQRIRWWLQCRHHRCHCWCR